MFRFTEHHTTRHLTPESDTYHTVAGPGCDAVVILTMWGGHHASARPQACGWRIPGAPFPSVCGVCVTEHRAHPDLPHVGVREEAVEAGWRVWRVSITREHRAAVR